MSDNICTILNSTIHHGKENNRVYLMKLNRKDNVTELITKLNQLAKTYGYTKIFAKAPHNKINDFLANNYLIEAKIPDFFAGKEDGYFLAKYLSEQRKENHLNEHNRNVLDAALKTKIQKTASDLKQNFVIKKAEANHVAEMINVYKTVFESYPFPIHDEDYIKQTMKENVIYYGIWDKNKLAALSSIELNVTDSYAEMTDFATLPDYRGNNLSLHLLNIMEDELRKQKIKTAFTIARAKSFAMNITFSKNNYKYGGTLINNTNIAGNIESMNVWYKKMID